MNHFRPQARDYCAKAVGLDTRPVIVRNYSDEEADILVVDYNINPRGLTAQRESQSLQAEAGRHETAGTADRFNSLQLGEKLNKKTSVRILAEQATDNVTSIQRYVRLNKLIPSAGRGGRRNAQVRSRSGFPLPPVRKRTDLPPAGHGARRGIPRRWDRPSGSSSSAARANWRITSSTSSCGRKSRWNARSPSATTACKILSLQATPRSRWRMSSSSCWRAGTASGSRSRRDEERTDAQERAAGNLFSILPSSGRLIIIRCGERGYYPSEWDTGNREENREIASSHNVRRGITDIQEAAMLAGSMFGWNTPGANPQWYLDNARYVNSNIVQRPYQRPNHQACTIPSAVSSVL